MERIEARRRQAWGAINTRSLRWLGVVVPLVFWLVVLLMQVFVLHAHFDWPAALTEVGLITLGSTLFANWVAVSLEHREAEIRRRSEHLEALRAAGLALTTELDLAKVLQRVVELSRALVNARYGALAVLASDGTSVEQFYTVGMTPEQRAAMGAPPDGHGLLGVLSQQGQPLRLDNVQADPRAVGFPVHHPAMSSLLGVPIISKGTVFGNLYLADKRLELPSGGVTTGAFSAADQEVLEMFALQAAIAIENAKLYRENQQLAVLRERDRIGMDLHDGVIQSIYAIGLMLDDSRHRLESDGDPVRAVHASLTTAINSLNEVIRDIRNYIVDLRPQRFQGRNVKQGLEQLARDLRMDTLFAVQLDVDSQAAAACTARQADEFLHIAQESLANIRKHAQAKTIIMRFGFADGLLRMWIQDDGAGMDLHQARASAGNGLRNIRERARALHGEFRLDSTPGSGTKIVVTAPIEKRDA